VYNKFSEFDQVVLTKDSFIYAGQERFSLKAGTRGVVVEQLSNNRYIVDFTEPDSMYVHLGSINADRIRLARS